MRILKQSTELRSLFQKRKIASSKLKWGVCTMSFVEQELMRFINEIIVPNVDTYELQEAIPLDVIRAMGDRGLLCPLIPKNYGGVEYDLQTIGRINEKIGQASASVRSVLTVQGMVSLAILKFGTEAQKEKWLPKLVSGKVVGGFALAEEEAGCDSSNLSTTYTEVDEEYELVGKKTWVTMGQVASLFLVFARSGEEYSAFLVEKDRIGLQVEDVTGMLGLRASMVANVTLDNVRLPKESLLGRLGSALRFIVPTCLDYGRYTVACGCVGLSQACIDVCYSYVEKRKQFGTKLKDFQMIQRMLAKMVTQTKASRLLCQNAAKLKEEEDFGAITDTCVAKYYASTSVNEVASMAVQILGAYGCLNEHPVERYFRDAKLFEIIEGSTQILEIMIANNYLG